MTVSITFDHAKNEMTLKGISRQDFLNYISEQTGSEIKTHMALAVHVRKGTRKCFPGAKTLAKATGLSLPTLRRAIAGLVEKNFITQTFRKGTSPLYHVGEKETFPKHVVVEKESLPGKNLYPNNNNKPLGERNLPPSPKELDPLWEPVREKLTDLNIKPRVAARIIEKARSDNELPSFVVGWIKYYKSQKADGIANSVGYLIKGILDDWGLDETYRKAGMTPEERHKYDEGERIASYNRMVERGIIDGPPMSMPEGAPA